MSRQNDKITLSEFLKENSSLFTVLGVFGAISVYFLRYPSSGISSQVQAIGTVSSLVAFLTVAVAIHFQLSDSIGRNIIDFLYQPTKRHLFFMIFLISYYTLIGSITMVVYANTAQFLFLIQYMMIFVGGSFVLLFIKLQNKYALLYSPDQSEVEDGVHLLWASRWLIIISSLPFAIGSILLIELNQSAGYHPADLLLVDSTSVLSTIVGSFSTGLVIFSLLYYMIASFFLIYCIAVIIFVKEDAFEILIELLRKSWISD